jgi:hypothetical protein
VRGRDLRVLEPGRRRPPAVELVGFLLFLLGLAAGVLGMVIVGGPC